jgi:hypothetical protein
LINERGLKVINELKAPAEPAIGLHFQTIQERRIPEGTVLFGNRNALLGTSLALLGRQISPFLSDKRLLSIKLEQMRAFMLAITGETKSVFH